MILNKGKIGVGVVGLGVGEQHAHTYARLNNCSVKWLYDISDAKADEVSRRVGHVSIAQNLEQILIDSDVSVLSLATFEHFHFDEVIAAFNAGKHVFVEKPLCQSIEELSTIKKCWEDNGRPHLQSNLILRSAPLYKHLKDIIEDGELGTIYAIDGDYLYGRLHKITNGWRESAPNYSVMESGGIHMIDLMTWLANERPNRVATVGNDISTKNSSFNYNGILCAGSI